MTVTLSNGLALAEIADVFGGQSWSFGVGTVPEFTVPAVDLDRVLSRRGLLHDGAVLVNDGHRWEIAATEREYRGEDIWLTFTARSQFARRLRNMLGPDRQKGVTPGEWIRGKAKKAGGSALVEAGAKARLIVQKRNESVLAVIEALASDTSTEWVFDGDRLLVGTSWWAFQGTPGLPLWPCPMDGRRFTFGEWLNPVSLSTRSSIDDRGQEATATLTVESDTGWKVRPWHRVDLSGADSADNGLWLVTEASREEGKPDTVLTLSRPLKSAPKDGSSGKPNSAGIGGVGDYTIPEDGWVPGADKTWRMCNKPPREIVAAALREQANGVGWGSGNCLNWVSHICTGSPPYFGASGGHGGLYARYVWDKMPPGTPHGSDRNAPAGALVVWRHNSIGHIAVSVGKGKMVTTANGPLQLMGIGDYMGWGGYAGWMAPNFYM